jgi:zinc transporter
MNTGSTSDNNGLITAYLLDSKGGGKKLGWSDINQISDDEGIVWIHLDYTKPASQQWLRENSGLDELICDALLAEETRPRSVATSDGLLVTLRGMNLNPGANPEDMVSIRIWITDKRIISTRRRHLLSIDDLRRSIDQGHGPATPGEFLVHLADRLSERMANVIDNLEEAVDRLQEQVLIAESHKLRTQITAVRLEAISLRRYLAPQREAMSRLYNERLPWLNETERMQLREIADRILRYVEDLDAARERVTVTQEELMSRLSEQMDRRMYILSIVAAIFLPLGFLTGLLGINVGGIPGSDYKGAFIIFMVMIVIIVLLQLWIFKRKKWM